MTIYPIWLQTFDVSPLEQGWASVTPENVVPAADGKAHTATDLIKLVGEQPQFAASTGGGNIMVQLYETEEGTGAQVGAQFNGGGYLQYYDAPNAINATVSLEDGADPIVAVVLDRPGLMLRALCSVDGITWRELGAVNLATWGLTPELMPALNWAKLSSYWGPVIFYGAAGGPIEMNVRDMAPPVLPPDPPDPHDPWVPTVQDVSLLLRTRTVGVDQVPPNQGWLGGDTGPKEVTVFDETTRPTADEVEEIIGLAGNSFFAQLSLAVDLLPDLHYGTVRYIVALNAAILIEVSFFRESVNQDLLSLWRDLADRAFRGLEDALDEGSVPGRFRFGTLKIGTQTAEPESQWLGGVDPFPEYGHPDYDLALVPWFLPWPPGIPGSIPYQGQQIG